MSSTEHRIELTRLTGDKKYTDKMILTLATVSDKCTLAL